MNRLLLTAVAAVVVSLYGVGSVGAQYNTIPAERNTPTTTPTAATSSSTTTSTGDSSGSSSTTTDPFTEFEQMFLSGLREMLAERFPGADPSEIDFLADLVFDFFLHQLFFGNQQQMGSTSTQS